MKLKHELVNAISVDECDLTKFIRENYGVSPDYYDFQSDYEASNDSTYEFNVEKKELDKWDREALEEWKTGIAVPACNMTQIILTDLCNLGLIDAGIYYIWVCW